MQKEIKQTRHFSQSPQEVWEYLTKPNLLEQWLGKTDFQPIAGHKFRFISAYGNDFCCEVLDIKPFTRLPNYGKKILLKTMSLLHQKLCGHLFRKKKERNCNWCIMASLN